MPAIAPTLVYKRGPGAVRRARQNVPAIPPTIRVLLNQQLAAIFAGRLGTRAVQLASYTGCEVAEVVTKYHDDAVRFGDVLAASDFRSVPAVFLRQQHMRIIGGNTQLSDVTNGRFLLRTWIGITFDRIAGAVGNKENRNARLLRRVDEAGDAGHRVGDMLIVPLLKLPLCHRSLERHLEFRIADRRLIDIENYSGRQMRRVNLARLCTPGRVFDKTW